MRLAAWRWPVIQLGLRQHRLLEFGLHDMALAKVQSDLPCALGLHPFLDEFKYVLRNRFAHLMASLHKSGSKVKQLLPIPR